MLSVEQREQKHLEFIQAALRDEADLRETREWFSRHGKARQEREKKRASLYSEVSQSATPKTDGWSTQEPQEIRPEIQDELGPVGRHLSGMRYAIPQQIVEKKVCTCGVQG